MPYSSIPSCTPSWNIQPVPFEAADEYITFINDARSQMFPGRSLAPDNASLLGHGTCFLEARDGKQLIAAIGFVPYNHRFPQFKYHDVRTVEVVRLYVEPRYRRSGLATALFKELCERAKEQDLGRLYMHTHPFLPGAIGFWQKHGFEIVEQEEDPVWQTTHMQMVLSKRQSA
jgi:GNAT superfamily N-acetyltransferase